MKQMGRVLGIMINQSIIQYKINRRSLNRLMEVHNHGIKNCMSQIGKTRYSIKQFRILKVLKLF